MRELPDQLIDLQITEDSMFNGAVMCRQFRNGYRFSVDAVLAAHFHIPERGARVLDLGAGCGIIGLIVMHRWRERIASVSAFEIQPQLCDLICQNFRINAFENACFCVQGDVKTILNHLEPESFSQVICNPPFYRPENGRQNKNSESMIARHQIAATLMDFTKAAAAAVKNGGSVVFVYPAEMFTELADSFLGMRLEIKNLQFVYSYSDTNDEARLVLVRCVKNGGRGVKVAPPFYIYARKNGQFSKEMQRLYAPVYPVVE